MMSAAGLVLNPLGFPQALLSSSNFEFEQVALQFLSFFCFFFSTEKQVTL
jgi:hypothetical protein